MQRSTLVLILLALFTVSTASAQGLLISSDPDHRHRLPRPIPRPIPGQPGFIYDIAKLEIDASIRNQVAEVQVGQTFKNRTSRTLQVKFVFPLPYDGAIDQMTFMVDGQELEGRLLEADKAREIYQSYVRRSQDPALVQWIGTGMFQTQVFPVPPGAERTVSLRYTQVCRRSGSLNDWLLPLSPTKFTSQPIGQIEIRGRIRSDTKLGNVYSPSHEIELKREGDKVARFEYVARSTIPANDFRVMWDTGDNPVQMSVVAHRSDPGKDGYFMLMLQPQFPATAEDLKKSSKNVVLVLDKSGSMRGDKIDQARRAARDVVGRLKGRDQFTLINYDSDVEMFSSELTKANKPARAEAKEYIDSMLSGGSTNIDEALRRALELADDADGPLYIVFMTDGQPTVGEKNGMKIAENVRQRLREGTRLFSLGVGHDVNSRLLDKLASVCLGQTSYIRPGQPIDDVVSNLYDRIGAPALIDAHLAVTIDGKENRASQLYPSNMYDLFSGDQLVIVGRYRKAGQLKIKLTGEFLGERQEYVFEDELPTKTGSGKNVFVERLWATRRIGQIIDEIDLHGEEKELVDELIVLSKRHGILTPYTAYLAEEETDLNDVRGGRRITSRRLEQLEQEAGRMAFQQRAFKSELRSASRAASPAQTDNLFGAAPAPPADAALGSGGLGSAAAPSGRARPNASGNRPTIVGDFAISMEELQRRDAPLERVKQIATKTFFLREGRYIDSDATTEQIEKPEKVEQFSDKYFELLKELDEESKAYFAEEVELLVIVQGKAYLITPPKAEKKKP